MIESKLKNWIAQSESWETFKELNLGKDKMAEYTFLEYTEDFYISAFNKLFDLLDTKDINKGDLLSIAKALEIFSLENTRYEFQGVNFAENMLFSSGLYYLADFAASAYILANLFSINEYKSEIGKFISSFLRRDFEVEIENQYINQLKKYLESGDIELLDQLYEKIDNKVEYSSEISPKNLTLNKLAKELISKFRYDNIWKDLISNSSSSKNDWNKLVEKKLEQVPPMWSFFPSQREVLRKGILKSDKTFSLQMPTSSGKTAICELILFNEIKNNSGKKVLFLAPFRALASELKKGFGKRLAKLGIKSKTIYGGNIVTKEEEKIISKVDLLIATPEKFKAIGRTYPEVYEMFSVIICDEGHLLDDSKRGLSYELLLSKFKNNNKVKRKFIFLSAIIPNIKDINSWLGGENDTVVKSDYRPVELNHAFLKKMGNNEDYMLDVNPTQRQPDNYQIYNFLTKEEFQYVKERTGNTNKYKYDSKKTLAVATSLKTIDSGTVALFSPHKKGSTGVVGLTEETIKQLDLLSFSSPLKYAEEETINDLEEYFTMIFGEKYLLTRAISYGVAFHHGDLPQNVREVIEDALQKEEIKIVICTNTLAEGVNLPIKNIIIYSVKRFNPKTKRREPLRIRDIKNLVGRAGRAGKETKGFAITINNNDFDVLRKVIDNEKNEKVETVNGYFHFIINKITDFIKTERLKITNELLEHQKEWFKQLIDDIDISIIDLLAEEIEVDNLIENIDKLVENTFAFKQSTDIEKDTLKKVFHTRGKKLKSYIESDEFDLIKSSGSSLRLYDFIKENIDIKNKIWNAIDDPTSDEWIDFFLDIVLKVPKVVNKVEKFIENNDNVELLDIIIIIKLWIKGKWYSTMAEKTNLDVNTILELFSSVIKYPLQNVSSNIIKTVKDISVKENIEISNTIVNWPKFLLYGLKSKLQLDLIELGFKDRINILALSEWINIRTSYTYIIELKRFILENNNRILNQLKDDLPKLAYEKLRINIKYLDYDNIY